MRLASIIAVAVALTASPVLGGMEITKTDRGQRSEAKAGQLRPEVRIALHCHFVARAAADTMRGTYGGTAPASVISNAKRTAYDECMLRYAPETILGPNPR